LLFIRSGEKRVEEFTVKCKLQSDFHTLNLQGQIQRIPRVPRTPAIAQPCSAHPPSFSTPHSVQQTDKSASAAALQVLPLYS